MEVLQLTCIALYEGVKYLFTGKFNHDAFWYRCIHVNPIYTKFFQAVAAKYNIHAAVHTIPYTTDEIVYPVGVATTNIIGAGLISIVFEGIYEDQHVVVKTKRKNIDRRIYNGLASIHRMISFTQWFCTIPTIVSAYEEISELFLMHLDYCQESENHANYKKIFANHKIHIPSIIACTDSQIIMTKIDHIPLSSLSQDEKRRAALQLTDLIVHSLFNGFIHCDLHVANILFSQDNIGIIDFGCMVQITELERSIFIDLFKTFVVLDFQSATTHTMQFVGPTSIMDTLSPEIIADIRAFIIHTYLRATCIDHCFSVYDLIEITTKLRKHGLFLSPLFSKIAVSLFSIENVLSQLSATPSDIMIQTVLSILETESE